MKIVSIFLAMLILGATSLHSQYFDIRIAHLITGGPAKLDVYLFNTATPSVAALDYENASATLPHLFAATGNVNVKIAATGAPIANAFINRDIAVSGIKEYIGVAYGTQAQPKLAVLERDATQFPTPGNAFLRILNASTLSMPVDIYLDSLKGSPVFSGVAKDGSTVFAEVEGQPKTMYITAAGSTTAIARLITPLGDGSYRTVIITGSDAASLKAYALNGENPDLHVMQSLQQAIGTGALPTLRFVNALSNPSVTRVDTYLNSLLKVETLVYHSASESFGPLSLDSAFVQYTPAKEGTLNTILSSQIPLKRDTNYIAVITQIATGAPTPMLLKTSASETPAPPTKWKVRIANTNPFFSGIKVVLKQSGGDYTFDSIEFRSATTWQVLPSGSTIMEAYRNGEPTPFYTTKKPFEATSETFVTILVTGDSSGVTTDILNETDISSQKPMASFDGVRTGVRTTGTATDGTRLSIAPNPVSGTATIRYRTDKDAHVTLRLIDETGRIASVILDERKYGGEYEATFNAAGYQASNYSLVMSMDGRIVSVQSILVVK